MQCENCKWWLKYEKIKWEQLGSPIGECHFNPPNPAYINRNKEIDLLNLLIIWPLTKSVDFCSNFQDKNPPEIKEEKSKGFWNFWS